MPAKRIRYETLQKCIHGNQAFRCTQCGYKKKKCPHDKQPYKCKKCQKKRKAQRAKQQPNTPKRHPRCEHNRIKYSCRKCNWHTQECKHGATRNQCPKCQRHPRTKPAAPTAATDEDEPDFSDIWQDVPIAVQEIDSDVDCLLLDA